MYFSNSNLVTPPERKTTLYPQTHPNMKPKHYLPLLYISDISICSFIIITLVGKKRFQ